MGFGSIGEKKLVRGDCGGLEMDGQQGASMGLSQTTWEGHWGMWGMAQGFGCHS